MGNYKFYPFTRETLMAKLTGGDYFHKHSLMETTLSFFAVYDTRVFPQSGRGKKKVIITTELHCNTNTLEVELFRLAAYIKAINLQPNSPHIVFELYKYRAGNMPHNILLNIFLIMVSIDSLI